MTVFVDAMQTLTAQQIPEFTWSGRPSAAGLNKGRIIRITDVKNMLFVSDGTRWVAMSLITLYAGAVTPASGLQRVINTTAETTLLDVPVKGGILGPNGFILIGTTWGATGTASKQLRIKMAGLQLLSTALTTQVSGNLEMKIRNAGAENAQVAYVGSTSYTTATTALLTSSIDTSADFMVSFTGQPTVTTESVQLVGCDIFVLGA